MTEAQVPIPHRMHEPVQASLQHTPSAQKPDAHWVLPPQDSPFGVDPIRRTHHA